MFTGPAQGCGGNINATSGTLIPPRGLDGKYLANLDCVWVLTAPDNNVWALALNDIRIEAGSGGSCGYDGLEVRIISQHSN